MPIANWPLGLAGVEQLPRSKRVLQNCWNDSDGSIINYKLRQQDQKKRAVQAFQSLNFNVIAAGDSYNDLSMLQSADHAVLFRPPESMKKEFPDFPVTEDHPALRSCIEKLLQSQQLV